MTDIATTIPNERIKLLATFINRESRCSPSAVRRPYFRASTALPAPQASTVGQRRLFYRGLRATFRGQHNFEETAAMATLEMISLLIMPVAGLIIAGSAICFANHMR